MIPSTFVNPVNHKGWIRFRQGYEEEGLLLVREAMRLDPEYGGVYVNAARMRAARREESEAIGRLRQAVEILEKYRRLARVQKVFEGLRERQELQEAVGN